MTGKVLRGKSACLSRRHFLMTSAGLAASVAVASSPNTDAFAASKVSKTFARYQDHPHNGHHCSLCVHFRGPHSCELVDGTINPNGVCRFFKPMSGKSAGRSKMMMHPKSHGSSGTGGTSGGTGY